MSIASGTVASKLMGLNNTKTALSGVLADWGETVPSTFAAYPEKFDNVFTNLDAKIDAVSSCAVMISGDQSVKDVSLLDRHKAGKLLYDHSIYHTEQYRP